ncbi:MAG: GreA/GreB family elongation factor [Patescibacteria group bacterium]|jgi:transcription elongation GreA/GreB family factor
MDREVKIGDCIRIELDGQIMELNIIDVLRKDMASNSITASSPLAQEILGRGCGEIVEFKSPSGLKSCRILEIVSYK